MDAIVVETQAWTRWQRRPAVGWGKKAVTLLTRLGRPDSNGLGGIRRSQIPGRCPSSVPNLTRAEKPDSRGFGGDSDSKGTAFIPAAVPEEFVPFRGRRPGESAAPHPKIKQAARARAKGIGARRPLQRVARNFPHEPVRENDLEELSLKGAT